MSIYITGDTHGVFERLIKLPYNLEDLVIILGDTGINYYLDERDKLLKERLNKCYKLFCIQGNHEERPENIKTYHEVTMYGGTVYIEDEYPNLIFAKNGEEYLIDGNKILVIGGAYSVDKYYRLMYGYRWFEGEQLTKEEKENIYEKCQNKQYDIVLTHTCPKKYIPTEMFLDEVDQSTVDNSMEEFLDKMEESISYEKWYCGHYHTDKTIAKITFMYEDIKTIGGD